MSGGAVIPMTPEEREAVLEAQVARHVVTCQTVLSGFRALFGFAVIPATVFCSQYPASALAGESTGLNMTISLGLTVGLGGTAAALGLWGRHQKKRADDAEGQKEKLQRRNVKLLGERNELRDRLRALERSDD